MNFYIYRERESDETIKYSEILQNKNNNCLFSYLYNYLSSSFQAITEKTCSSLLWLKSFNKTERILKYVTEKVHTI